MEVLRTPPPSAEPLGPTSSGQEIMRLRDLSGQQWKSGIAAWLGWLFDGLDMHLYTLVAAPFVATLLHAAPGDSQVKQKGAIIQGYSYLDGHWAARCLDGSET